MTVQSNALLSSIEKEQFQLKIETQRLLLRPFEDRDIEDVYDIAMQPGFHFLRLHSTERYVPELGRRPTPDDVWASSAALVRHCQENMLPQADGLPKELKLAVCLKANPNKVIGYRSFGPLHDPSGQERDIGSAVHKGYQCNGLSSEAGKAVIGTFYYLVDNNPTLFAGEKLDVNATVHPANIASQKGLSKMYFEPTGQVTTTMVQGVEEPRLCYSLNKDMFLKEAHYSGIAIHANYQRNKC